MTVNAVLPVMKPLLPSADAVLPYLRRMDTTGQYANRGPLVLELEARYAQHLGVAEDCVVAASSATSALIGAVTVSGLSNWLLPDFTFPAPALAALAAGATVTLHDVSPSDWQLDVTAEAIGPDSGLLPVLPFGAPLDMSRWPASATVVVDAASSMGASRGRLMGLPSTWAVVFSLHATKVLPAGEGGVVVFGTAAGAAAFRQWANFGFDGGNRSWTRGQNAKMSEVCAAYGLASLASWPREETEWLAAQGAAAEVMQDLGSLTPRPGPQSANPFWVVQFESPDACDLAERTLRDDGIGTRKWWRTLHTMPAFEGCSHESAGTCDELAETTLGLPMFRGLGPVEVDRVGASLLRAGLT